jgi:hypothetical protein
MARRRGVGKAVIDRGAENTSLTRPSVRCAAVGPKISRGHLEKKPIGGSTKRAFRRLRSEAIKAAAPFLEEFTVFFVERVEKPTDDKPCRCFGTPTDVHPSSAGKGDQS